MTRILKLSSKIVLGFALLLALSSAGDGAHAAGFKSLYIFCSQMDCPDGDSPETGLIQDVAGNLYGTTTLGGFQSSKCPNGCGVVFKLAPDGTEIVLHAFKGYKDGGFPIAGLIMDGAGNLYGTTAGGGEYHRGTVYRIAPDGKKTILYAFKGRDDGAYPRGGLLADGAGNLYGTTVNGGGRLCLGTGCGTVFKLAPDGTETVLFRFNDWIDGAYPSSNLIADNAGNLYGTASRGGGTTTICSFGCGVVFKLAPNGALTVLHSFTSGKDGAYPNSGVTMDGAGNLYGTTADGGRWGCSTSGTSDCGTVYKVAPDGTETVLHGFCASPCRDAKFGAGPTGGVVIDGTGNLYGVAAGGGRNGGGTVFKIAPDGAMTVMHEFDGFDGAGPEAGLLIGNNGLLYGTTAVGGLPHVDGTIFEVKE